MTKAQRRVARIKEMLKCPHTYAPETCNATDPAPAAQPDNPTPADRKCDADVEHLSGQENLRATCAESVRQAMGR